MAIDPKAVQSAEIKVLKPKAQGLKPNIGDVVTLQKLKQQAAKEKLDAVSKGVEEDAESAAYTLWYKDPEQKKTLKWYSANSLEELVKKVNKGNTGEDYDLPVVDEDRVFNSVKELLDYCSHSDFFIKGPDGELASGYQVKPGDWDEDAEEEKHNWKTCSCEKCKRARYIADHVDKDEWPDNMKESTNIANFLKAISQKNYAQADKYLQGTVESKLRASINRAIQNSK